MQWKLVWKQFQSVIFFAGVTAFWFSMLNLIDSNMEIKQTFQMVVHDILRFLLGAAVGTYAAYLYFKTKYERKLYHVLVMKADKPETEEGYIYEDHNEEDAALVAS